MDRTRLQEGMIVYGPLGEKLGKVLKCDEQTFVIEKGTLFKREHVARYEDVVEVTDGGEVRLARGEEALGVVELERGASAEEGPLGEVSPTGAGGGAETIPTEPVTAESEEPAARSPGEPRTAPTTREQDEAGATVTYGMGEDPGSTHARRDDFDDW